MNFIDKKRGDEGKNSRLLSSFQKQFAFEIKEIYRIRDNVFKLSTFKGTYILKGYSSYSRLKLQEAFTASLKKEGFNKTYSFINFDQEPIVYKSKYFGCLPYIEPHQHSFSYKNVKEREEGLALLDEYHQISRKSVQRYQTILPEYNLQTKWSERLNHFHQNVNTISKYLPTEMILEWIHWAEWSLEGINKYRSNIEKEPLVILHGDVAHHNFLRRNDGKLFLIDFDLISIGPRSMDLLQYANRILHYINWDIKTFSFHKSLKKLLSNQAYIHALAYPTDLFREWNRLIREGSHQKEAKLDYMIEQSFNKINQRQQFISELKKLCKNGLN